jgi:hypothetical protein
VLRQSQTAATLAGRLAARLSWRELVACSRRQAWRLAPSAASVPTRTRRGAAEIGISEKKSTPLTTSAERLGLNWFFRKLYVCRGAIYIILEIHFMGGAIFDVRIYGFSGGGHGGGRGI